MTSSWSRDVPIDPARAAFLMIDVNLQGHKSLSINLETAVASP
jgi:hypothetical protein